MLLATPALSTLNPLSVMAPEPYMHPRQVLSEADLASRWGMSPKTLQRWRMEGRGPHRGRAQGSRGQHGHGAREG